MLSIKKNNTHKFLFLPLGIQGVFLLQADLVR